ncbi:MAG TPA: hypothetical protein VHB20_15675 [Verrucomicrobiae bacterium]|nr:hypothetical protein [Verrucomicrobiae bacterium]
MSGLLEITAAYSNAVLIAILPQISEFASELHLPVNVPIARGAIQRFACAPFDGDPGGYLVLTNGYEFWYDFGHVKGFAAPHSYYRLQNPHDIPAFYGRLNMTQQEAVDMARHALCDLGYSVTNIFADSSPSVVPPPQVEGHVVPVYRIEWHNPLEISTLQTSIDIEVNGDRKSIQNMWLASRCFYRKPPKIEASAPPKGDEMAIVPADSNALLNIALPKIRTFALSLNLPIEPAIRPAQVASLDVSSTSDFCVKLTNGFRFWYQRGDIRGYSAPDAVFVSEPGVPQLSINSYTGEWKLSASEAAQTVLAAIARLGYTSDDFEGEHPPNISKPTAVTPYIIPRFSLRWLHNDEYSTVSSLDAEVDAGSGLIKSFYMYQRNWEKADEARKMAGKLGGKVIKSQ